MDSLLIQNQSKMDEDDLSRFLDSYEFALPADISKPHVTLDVPPQLVWECAAGLENPADIARRLGLTDERWEQISQWGPFISAVQSQRAQFEKEGVTFRLKAGLMADQLMNELFKQTIGTDSTILQKQAVLNSLVEIAGIKAPKKEASAGDGKPQFSITINIPKGSQPVTIDG
jgi:hypothetical protein